MRRIVILMAILVFASVGNELFSQVGKFQALYLVNFTKNIEWPNSNVTIGVVGNTKTLIELEALVAKYPNISLKKISGSESVDKCQMIFLPSAQSRNFALIQQKIGDRSIVLVTEDQELASKGAEIGFYMEGNKLKFVLNKSALDKAKVKVADKLYGIGKTIE